MLTIVSVLFLLVKKNITSFKSSKYNSVFIYIFTDAGGRTRTLDILGRRNITELQPRPN